MKHKFVDVWLGRGMHRLCEYCTILSDWSKASEPCPGPIPPRPRHADEDAYMTAAFDDAWLYEHVNPERRAA
jgi:hypothetical protein